MSLPIVLVVLAIVSSGFSRVFPQRAVMVGGYYGRPSTTAFVSGETIAANSYSGEQLHPDSPQPNPEYEIPVHDETANEDAKNKPGKNNEEGENSWPFNLSGRSYAFFPIMFGGGNAGNGEASERRQGSSPGNPTAIANSFSTGRGGIATSHATAYGDPYTATLLRNLYGKGAPKQE